MFDKLKVKKAKKVDVRNYQNEEFCIPVVYCKFGDNGIMYWGRKGKFTTCSNVMSVIYNGEIATGRVYAQEHETGILAESYFIKYKSCDVSFKVNLFFSKVIERVLYNKYSRDNLATWSNKVENDYIMLPVNHGVVDFKFMEDMITKIEEETRARVDKYLSDNGLNSAVSEHEKQILTEKKKFAKFKIGKIVSLYSSKKKINANTVEFNGKHPYVARSSENNGIRGYIDHDLKDINAGNTISFGQDTATVFYQENDYFTGDKIKVMEFLVEEHSLNFKLAQYIICSMRKAFAGFSWGTTSFNENILNEIQFILPIQDNIIDSTYKYHDKGYVPDWDYMEKYIDVLMRQTAARVE